MWAQLWRCQHVTVVAGGVLFDGGGVCVFCFFF